MPLNATPHDLLAQRRLTQDHGEFVRHYRVLKCSCMSGPEDHPDPTCLVCGGSGRAYTAPTTIKGLIAGINASDKALLQSGLAMPGDMTFSPELYPGIRIHDYDVIRLRYGQAYEGDVIRRGEDTLFYLPATIRNVERHDPETGTRTAYWQGIDFSLSGRLIVWASGAGPAAGQSYSVAYDAYFDWVVYPGVTLARIARNISLGQRVLLRKRHLAGFTVILPD